MIETVFVIAVRTPLGKYMGSLKTVRVQDLAAQTMKASVERAGIDSSALEMSQYYIFHTRYEMGPRSMCFHDQKIEIETNAQPQELYGKLTAATIADIIAKTMVWHEKSSMPIQSGIMRRPWHNAGLPLGRWIF